VTEGLLYESKKTAILKIFNLFKIIPTTLRATSFYTRDALILIPAKPKKSGLSKCYKPEEKIFRL